ncbi:MAG: hypothetical protein MZU84_04580 [Sphingobacterium sp.]|nr:hypothetical protein [Sphingobacterium sp.]
MLTITSKATGTADEQAGDVGRRRDSRQRGERHHLLALPRLVPARRATTTTRSSTTWSTGRRSTSCRASTWTPTTRYVRCPNTENNPREPYRPDGRRRRRPATTRTRRRTWTATASCR